MADSFDIWVSNLKMSKVDALNEIKDKMGIHYDAKVAKAFLRALERIEQKEGAKG